MDGIAKNPIRILCVFSTLDRGGAETMCMNLYRRMDRSKVQFDFVKHTENTGDYEEEILSLGGEIYTAPHYTLFNQHSYQRWWKRHLSQHPEHQIIHGHFFTVSSVYFSVAKKMGRITIGHSHATKETAKDIKQFLRNRIVSNTEKYSDYCFACGKEAGKCLYPNKDFIVLNNAVDSRKFQYNPRIRNEIRTHLNIDSQFVIGVVGTIKKVKNPYGVLSIFESILKINPESRLLWIGNGDMRKEIEQKAKDNGIGQYVMLLGVRDDVDRMMQAMDVFILPSFSEGLPVVGIEAQAAGLPCFFSDQITTEVDVTGNCRFLSLSDYDAWADEILNIDVTRRMDTRQKIIEAGYDIHTTAKWLQEFYLKIATQFTEEEVYVP